MNAYITSIGIANPAHRIKQSDIARFMSDNLEYDAQKKRELDILYRATGIGHRYSVLQDYAQQVGKFKFYPNELGLEPFPSVAQRMELFKKEALPLALKAIKNCGIAHEKETFTHLITVSCTGMYAPGLDIEITKTLGLSSSIQRTSINFMGCYAAINALKMATEVCTANTRAKVLVICVELCSIHFQKRQDDDSILANSLFGDGAAAIVVEPNPTSNINLQVEAFHCDLATEGHQDMAWHIGDFGFEMALSSYVPEIIQSGIKSLTDRLLSKLQLSIGEIDHFAIHPGGKKILDALEQELQITRDDNRHAHAVLRSYGNMSSPTVLFVLHSILDSLNEENKDEKILSFAFGPGLTLESMLFSVQ